MKRSSVVLAVVVVVLAAALWWWYSGRSEQVAVDLLAQYPTAEKRSSIAVEEAFSLRDETIGGQMRTGIYMHPTSRLTFKKVTVPDDARLRVFLGVKEEAWDKQSDGVLFRFAVSDGRQYDELLSQHVDPAHNANDRGWQPVDIDLSAYAGQQVDLIFNTNSSVKGAGDNPGFDFAVWGSPALVIKP